MARLIHVAIGDARIVHDKAVICKECGPYMNNIDAICGVCAFAGENCSDIACTPLDRDDEKFVYFEPIKKANNHGKENYVEIGDTRIIHGVCVTCKEAIGFCHACAKCAFRGLNCDDIPCTPFQREDGVFVYFKLIKKA